LTTGALGRLAGFWLCCCQAAFAFTGTEIIGITANEAEQPRTTLPHAVRRIVKRLVFYYIGAAFVLGINLSANDPQLAWYVNNPKGSYQGPFVLMMQRANIPVLSHILNSVVLIACLSVANANLYETVSPFFHY
jgi:yeast amino acid transporter